MLDNAGRERHARHGADALRPQSGTVHQNIAGDGAARRHDADGAAAFDHDLLDANAFLDPRAMHARALGIGHGQ